MQSYTARESISNIERGIKYANRDFRQRFSMVLNSPILEYFPHSIQNFPERLRIRFQSEQEASQYLLRELTTEKIELLTSARDLYIKASTLQASGLMLGIDEYLHTEIINHHPDPKLRDVVTRYRQDFIELFKIWIPLLDLNIVRQLKTIHVDLFEAVLNQNQNEINQTLDAHLVNSLNDLETVINLLE